MKDDITESRRSARITFIQDVITDNRQPLKKNLPLKLDGRDYRVGELIGFSSGAFVYTAVYSDNGAPVKRQMNRKARLTRERKYCKILKRS